MVHTSADDLYKAARSGKCSKVIRCIKLIVERKRFSNNNHQFPTSDDHHDIALYNTIVENKELIISNVLDARDIEMLYTLEKEFGFDDAFNLKYTGKSTKFNLLHFIDSNIQLLSDTISREYQSDFAYQMFNQISSNGFTPIQSYAKRDNLEAMKLMLLPKVEVGLALKWIRSTEVAKLIIDITRERNERLRLDAIIQIIGLGMEFLVYIDNDIKWSAFPIDLLTRPQMATMTIEIMEFIFKRLKQYNPRRISELYTYQTRIGLYYGSCNAIEFLTRKQTASPAVYNWLISQPECELDTTIYDDYKSPILSYLGTFSTQYLISLLRSGKANVHIVPKASCTHPFYYASPYSNELDIFLLITYGADPLKKINDGDFIDMQLRYLSHGSYENIKPGCIARIISVMKRVPAVYQKKGRFMLYNDRTTIDAMIGREIVVTYLDLLLGPLYAHQKFQRLCDITIICHSTE